MRSSKLHIVVCEHRSRYPHSSETRIWIFERKNWYIDRESELKKVECPQYRNINKSKYLIGVNIWIRSYLFYCLLRNSSYISIKELKKISGLCYSKSIFLYTLECIIGDRFANILIHDNEETGYGYAQEKCEKNPYRPGACRWECPKEERVHIILWYGMVVR